MKTDRRTFIRVVAAGSGALVLDVGFGRAEKGTSRFEPNAWLRIESDGTIVVRVGKSEMGQGVRTSLPMILAEELDAPLDSIRIEQASPGRDFQRLGTGGSSSMASLWNPLRQAGAAARSMLIAAAAARWNVAADGLIAREGSVLHEASGRRATYADLAAEAARQTIPDKPRLKDRSAYRIVGRPRKRADGNAIVTGAARYGLDVRVPGMLRAVIARAPQFDSRVVSFDAVRARAVAGVRAVLEIPSGVAVVADNTWAAMRGRDALTVRWSESPHASFDSREHRTALGRAIEQPGLTIRKDGEGRVALDKAARTIDATYFYPFAAHAAVEPVSSTALVRDESATIWSPTQAPNTVQAAAAKILGLPDTAITVNVTLVGGGFGRRLGVDFDREAIEVAKRIKGTPVQVVWSREDDMRHGYFQAASAHRLIAGLDEQGNVIAWEHRKASTPHNARNGPPSDADKKNPDEVRDWAWGVYNTPYAIPSMEMSYTVVDAPVPIGPWRSVFSPSSVFARECFVDEVAQATNRDPLAFRVALLGDGVLEIAGERVDRARLRRVLETVAEKSGWARAVPAGRARGLACNVFHTQTYIAYVVEVALEPFRVERVVCAVDCGLVVNPLGVAQQVESGVLWSLSNMSSEITIRNGAVEQATYADFPVPTIRDTPAIIETHIVPSDDDRPRGLGEPTVCPLAPAVANALSRLTGRRVRSLPLTAGH